MRRGALWKLISCSIRDKTALNVLIYLQAPRDRLLFCSADTLSNTVAARIEGEGAGGGVRLR